MKNTCKLCGKSFEDPKHPVRVYCSYKCLGASKRSKPKPCKLCGKLFKKKANHSRDKFCSKKCRYSFHVKENHPYWKGGEHINTNGYKRSGVTFQYIHRQVMEKHLGRKLKRNELVHHINGCKTDNRIENLRVMSCAEHNRLHNCGRKKSKTSM